MNVNRIRKKREVLRTQLCATGNLLMDALALDQHLARRYSRNPSEELLRQLKLCRRTVGYLVGDYTIAVARYRAAVKASFGPGSPRAKENRGK